MKLREVMGKEQENLTGTKLKLSSIKEETSNETLNNIKGAAFGIPALAGAGYGLYKSRIPQTIGRETAQIGRGIVNLPKVLNVNKGTDFAEMVRNSFAEAHTEMVNKFGNEIKGQMVKFPNTKVNLSELLFDLQTNPDISKQTLSILKSTPKLDALMENPKLASSVSLKDAQSIVNHLQTRMPKDIKVNKFDLLDTINTIKGQQLEAFPELSKARSEYRAFIEPYKNVKNYFKFNKVLNAIKNKFGGAEGQVAVEKILPKEVLKKMKGYRSAAKLAELPGDVPFLGKFFRSVGGALSVYPAISGAIDYARNPQAYLFKQMNPTINVPEEAQKSEEAFKKWLRDKLAI